MIDPMSVDVNVDMGVSGSMGVEVCGYGSECECECVAMGRHGPDRRSGRPEKTVDPSTRGCQSLSISLCQDTGRRGWSGVAHSINQHVARPHRV